jgi:hypothetical protein
MDGTPDYIIEVFCDDPRHADGKVAEIARFGRFVLSPHGEVRWLIWRDDRQSFSYTAFPGANVEVYRRYDDEPEKGSTYHWRCDLCPRSLETREDKLSRLLETTYQGLLKSAAGQGVSRVDLKVLRVIADSI